MQLLEQIEQNIKEVENIQEDLLEVSFEFQILEKARESYLHAKYSLSKLI